MAAPTTAPYSRLAQAFADGEPALAEMYDNVRTQLLTEHQALQAIVVLAAEPFSNERGNSKRERLNAALHYASIEYCKYDLVDADLAFGRGAR